MMFARLAILVMLVAPASAQGLAVYGEVVDSKGFVVIGALVTLTPAGGSEGKVTHTDPDGVFVLDGVRSGAYDLKVDASGFQPFTQRVTITDSTVQLRIVLRNADGARYVVPGFRLRMKLRRTTVALAKVVSPAKAGHYVGYETASRHSL
ncbi:MAG: hypothetical protein A3F70_08465 [Acidobacteria bacterium RIFCSPLOWO2_12_FULL_67_14]|nr:MAG: hypothetical protein A3H29_01630 [Acidobacteria bacterium RIFCSPLOWO2_02_FULL_67_21]OFW40755.1 MAG: hypothetical protein A3F70_08465 [Acidobacteria bacterium RIFCSPLOWO2_12_FULL_67_14]